MRDGDVLVGVQSKGLAVRVSEAPPTIQLLFEHKTGDQDAGIEAFYMHSKANRCACPFPPVPVEGPAACPAFSTACLYLHRALVNHRLRQGW